MTFEGLRQVEPPAVKLVLSTREGAPFSRSKVAEDIRAIYGMGYFSDVKVFRRTTDKGLELVYVVSEKPAVQKVQLVGFDELSEDDIKEVIDIRPFTILSEAKVKKNAEKIKDLYSEKGFYLAEVVPKTQPIEGTNQVIVVFEIIENAKVEVRRIRFIGNRNIDSDTLKTGLATQEGSLISFLTGAGTYRKDAFQVDLLRISAHYFDNGFINVKVDTPDIEISPDRRYIYMTIRIEEGLQYTVGKVDFSGDLLDSRERLDELTNLEEGEIFNRSTLGQDLLRLKTRYEDDGYAYANITPVTSVQQDKRLIEITFDVQKGEKVYYERINVVGNTKTRDKVVRRELRIYEGDLTSATMRELSRRRVQALGFFEKVDVKTRRGSSDTQQIVDIEVKERSTGTFQVGAGFSSAENFILTAQIAQDNFLGRGQSIALSAQISSLRQLFQLQFSEPYFFDSLWRFSFSGFRRETQFRSFLRRSEGGSLTFGHPVTDDINVFLTYNLEFVRSRGADGLRFQPAFQPLNNSGRISSVRLTGTYDTRNDRLFPSQGMFHTASAEFSEGFLGASDTRRFHRYNVVARFYWPIVFGFVGKLSLRAGYLFSRSTQPLSPSEKFIMGGINTLRGYLPFTIGPERRATRNDRGTRSYDPYSDTFTFIEGGNKQFLANFEIEFPIFEAVGIKGVLFLDAGNVWAEEENFFYIADKQREPQSETFVDPTVLGLFWSVGFGFRWFSPIGPLRFEWGIPLTKRPTDDKGPLFEFSIGNSF